MSLRLILVRQFDRKVSNRLPTECQKIKDAMRSAAQKT